MRTKRAYMQDYMESVRFLFSSPSCCWLFHNSMQKTPENCARLAIDGWQTVNGMRSIRWYRSKWIIACRLKLSKLRVKLNGDGRANEWERERTYVKSDMNTKSQRVANHREPTRFQCDILCVSLDVAIFKTFKGNSTPKLCDTVIYHFEINFYIHAVPFPPSWCSNTLNVQCSTTNPKQLYKRAFHSVRSFFICFICGRQKRMPRFSLTFELF